MKSKKWLWLLFGLMVIAQLSIPSWMIYEQEAVLRNGTEYRFKTAPVDPYDLMRGKYITLSYDENRASTKEDWQGDEQAFVTLANDDDGYAILDKALKEAPVNGEDYLILKTAKYQNRIGVGTVQLRLPFDRYYMEESKAQDAEELYRQSTEQVQNNSYALVMVKDGKAVLRDVIIDGIPIKQAVEELQDNSPD